uniref:Tick transposon n=1 Tax=Rhipicephalus zambeziensis TaxID=60191 RepID=A0A224YR79_9ACAR
MNQKPIRSVGLNLLGPFLMSTSGNRRIAIATDYAMWSAILCSLATSCTNNVADFLLHVILQHGAPRLKTSTLLCPAVQKVDGQCHHCGKVSNESFPSL